MGKLLGQGNPMPQGNNPINMIMQMLNNGGNPQQIMQQIMQNNPQASQMMAQMKNMAGGKSPKDFAMQLAKQNGVDPNQLMEVAKRMGLK